MKKLNTILTLSAIAFCITGCGIDIDEYKAGDPEGGEELKVTAQAEDPIVLQEKNSLETAIGLTWTSGSNFGTGNSISYTLDIDHAEGDWTECYTESLGKRIYSRDITVEELNNIVAGLGAKHGTSGEYKGRIRASVTDYPEMEQYSEFSFTATSYNPAPSVLYITGDATEGGWDAAKATQMTRTAGGIFTFEGIMEAGDEFRFISAAGNEWPAYIKTAGSQNGITYAESAPASADDINFSVTEKSNYRITVNLLEMTVTIEDIMINELYLIGDATPGGWSLDNLTKMENTGKGLFTWTGNLTTNGEGFKFVTGHDFWPGYVKANEDPADMSIEYFASDPGSESGEDLKFKISEIGEYTVSVNLFDLTISYSKTGEAEFSKLYLIGDATSAGWTTENAVEMQMTADGVYTWTGELKAGPFRFVVNNGNQTYAPGYWKASNDNCDMSIVYSDKSLPTEQDISFTITEAGEYTVTADTKNLFVTLTKTGFTPFEKLWIMGKLNEWSFDTVEEDATNKYVMFPDEHNHHIFRWTGEIVAGEFKISCDLDKSFFGTWYMPQNAGEGFSAGENKAISLVDRGSEETQSIDRNWNLTETGNYTIAINQMTSTMTVTKN